jgi:hypothetical protein
MEYCGRLPVVGADFGNQRQEDHMSHVFTRSRRIVIAVAVAALLGGTALLRGARNCIFINDEGQLPREWWNNIESYRWVTRSACLKAGPLPLFE